MSKVEEQVVFEGKEYKAIPGFLGNYYVSKDGEVLTRYGDKPLRKMKQFTNPDGYKLVTLVSPFNKKPFPVHRLVLMTYVLESPYWPKGMVTDHLNMIKDDNRLENLEIISNGDNIRRAVKEGRTPKKIRVKVKNVETGEVFEFNNCGECSVQTGVHREVIASSRIRQPWRVWPEGYQYQRIGEEFPEITQWDYLAKVPLMVKDLLTGLEYEFISVSEAAKFIGLAAPTISAILSEKEQPLISRRYLVKKVDEKPFRVILDLSKEILDSNAGKGNGHDEPVVVWSPDLKYIFFFIGPTVAGQAFGGINKTTVCYRASTMGKSLMQGFYWMYYRDWVVSKPFELRGPIGNRLVLTLDGDMPRGAPNPREIVKTQTEALIQKENEEFDNMPPEKVKSKLRRVLSIYHNKTMGRNPSQTIEKWRDKEQWLKDAIKLPGFNLRDVVMKRMVMTIIGERNTGKKAYYSPETVKFVYRPDYRFLSEE